MCVREERVQDTFWVVYTNINIDGKSKVKPNGQWQTNNNENVWHFQGHIGL